MSTPGASLASPLEIPVNDPVFGRLEDQIRWYEQKSQWSRLCFKWIKVIEIVAAAIIPFVAAWGFSHSALITAGLGVLITVLEGLLHLNQFQQNWITYRATCEALLSEKYLYLANASPYSGATNPRALLAERVESAVSQERAKWASVQQQDPKDK
jgi:hypothetical protein